MRKYEAGRKCDSGNWIQQVAFTRKNRNGSYRTQASFGHIQTHFKTNIVTPCIANGGGANDSNNTTSLMMTSAPVLAIQGPVGSDSAPLLTDRKLSRVAAHREVENTTRLWGVRVGSLHRACPKCQGGGYVVG